MPSRKSATIQSQDSDAASDATTPRLDVEAFDAAMKRRGVEGNVDAQAVALGMHRSTLFRLRRGETGPSAATAIRIAEYCKVPVGKLFPPRAAA